MTVKSIAHDMANRASEISQRIINSKLDDGTFAELGLTAWYPAAIQVGDNFVAELRIEKTLHSKAQVKTNSAQILFAADPDAFGPEKEETNCFAYLGNAGEVKEASFSVDEYLSSWENVPLFLINYKGVALDAGTLGKATAGATTASVNDYAVITALKQKKNMETWGSMEIKIHTRQKATDPYGATTSLIFDGGQHNDAKGRLRWFPDVNTAGSQYNVPGHPTDGVAVVYAGNSDDHGWVVIEDDFATQEVFNQDWAYCPEPACTGIMYATVDVQPANYGRINDQTRPFAFNCCGISEWDNGDDLVVSS